MQQHLMQVNQGMMGGYASPTSVTTELIQQYLDENKQLILAILDNQNTGKMEECARNQAKLQHNLMYLAAIADSQPPQATMAQQYPPNVMQSSPRYMQPQAANMMTPQSLMAARSSVLYAQPTLSPLQQHAAGHSQLGMNPNVTSGFNILHGEASMGGNSMNTGIFTDFSRSNGAGKQDIRNSSSADMRGGGSAGQSGDVTESLYLKCSEEEGS
ncbi:GRF-interacting factor 1-like isoform X1 [Typha latifolia]|uniref:GRF-interacting factor 1-like isoform X1 n=1 Tax=Typha latifolia TaxID=4733 RepID=UPI003C302A7F